MTTKADTETQGREGLVLGDAGGAEPREVTRRYRTTALQLLTTLEEARAQVRPCDEPFLQRAILAVQQISDVRAMQAEASQRAIGRFGDFLRSVFAVPPSTTRAAS